MVESGRLESDYPMKVGSGVRIPLSPPLLLIRLKGLFFYIHFYKVFICSS